MSRTVGFLVLALACVAVAPAALIDVALNQPASAAATYPSCGAPEFGPCSPSFGNDGDPSTHWSAPGFAPSWWEVDLGSSIAISQVTYQGANNSFDVLFDGVYLASGATGGGLWTWSYTLPSATAVRTIRFNFTGGSDWAVVYDMQSLHETGAVPEPGAVALLAGGILMLAAAGRKRHRRS